MTDEDDARGFGHLRAAASSLLLAQDVAGRVMVEHWGADLGPLHATDAAGAHRAVRRQRTHSSIDQPRLVELVTQTQAAYSGRPTLAGHRPGVGSPYFARFELTVDDATATARARDPAGIELTCRVAMETTGVLLLDYAVTNHGEEPFEVGAVLPSLPVPGRATELWT